MTDISEKLAQLERRLAAAKMRCDSGDARLASYELEFAQHDLAVLKELLADR